MKRRLFVDIDGVLAKFHPEKSLEEVATKGYSLNLEPQIEVVRSIKNLADEEQDEELELEVFILGAVLNDDCQNDKDMWLDGYLSEIDKDHRIYVPYGIQKEVWLRSIGIEPIESDILLDDFTKNLNTWHGVGVKLLNGINGTHGTWRGLVVNGKSDEITITKALLGIIKVA